MNYLTLITRACSLLYVSCCGGLSIAQEVTVDWTVHGKPELRNAAIEKQIDTLLSAMTLEQKVAQMIQPEIGYLTVDKMRQYGFGSYLNGGNSAPYGLKQAGPEIWLKYADEMYQASVDASQDGSSIPTIWGTDAMHGHSNVFGATLFPHNIGLGAARDPALIEAIGLATAKEVAATGIEWSFAPTVAVVRDDRWGRTYESYSEDPELVADYAGRMVMGIQGHPGTDFLQNYHRIATAKHFIGDGGTTGGIDRGDTRIDEQTLRDIHAAGYYAALQAGVQSVMASFNSWNGERVHGHKYLLTDVLKGKMGFDGFVVSDWNAHKFVDGCSLEQCAAAINAGVDVLMVPEHYEAFFHNTVAQVKSGIIPDTRIDDAVRRFLRAKIRWGVFTRGKPSERIGAQHPEWFNASEHKMLAREAARKSLVLLKNNAHALPVNPSGEILVTGDGANNIAMQTGGWSVSWQGTDNTNADFPNATSIFAGLRQQVEAAGGSIHYSADGSYTIKPDVAIVVIGEQPYAEWFGDKQTIRFEADAQKSLALLRQLKSAGIRTVTVFLSGRPMWINRLLNLSDAFVAAWLPGSEGQGVADVLLSSSNSEPQYNFTGKLSFSWPKYDNQYVLNWKDAQYDPLFPYGYGLTYQDEVTLGEVNEIVSDFQVKNTSGVIPLFVRNLSANVKWVLTDGTNTTKWMDASSGISADGQSITMQSVNLAYQEDGRKFTWNGLKTGGDASLQYITATQPPRHEEARYLNVKVRIDEWRAEVPIVLQVQCSVDVCLNAMALHKGESEIKEGQWVGLSIDTACYEQLPDNINFRTALRISAEGAASIALADIALVREPASGYTVVSCQEEL